MEKDFIHLEGTTLLELTHKITKDSVGPKTKDSGKVFYNPAMAGSRTRSVILMKKIIDSGFLGDSEIYAIDGLAASGLRELGDGSMNYLSLMQKE